MKADRYKDPLRCNDPFPTRLRDLMKERDVTQKTLADAAGVKRQTISAYTDGSADPTLPKLCAMADFFGVSLGNLVGREPAQHPENNDIMDRLGLSEAAIQKLEDCRAGKGTSVDDAIPVIISTLLETPIGESVLRLLAKYVFSDFSTIYDMDSTFVTPIRNLAFRAARAADHNGPGGPVYPVSAEAIADTFILEVPSKLKELRDSVKSWDYKVSPRKVDPNEWKKTREKFELAFKDARKDPGTEE